MHVTSIEVHVEEERELLIIKLTCNHLQSAERILRQHIHHVVVHVHIVVLERWEVGDIDGTGDRTVELIFLAVFHIIAEEIDRADILSARTGEREFQMGVFLHLSLVTEHLRVLVSGILHVVERVGSRTEGDVKVFQIAHGIVGRPDGYHRLCVTKHHCMGTAHGNATVDISVGKQLHGGRAQGLIHNARLRVGGTRVLVEARHIPRGDNLHIGWSSIGKDFVLFLSSVIPQILHTLSVGNALTFVIYGLDIKRSTRDILTLTIQ